MLFVSHSSRLSLFINGISVFTIMFSLSGGLSIAHLCLFSIAKGAIQLNL